MIFGKLGDERPWVTADKRFRTAFAFLHDSDLLSLPIGRVDLQDGIHAMVQQYDTKDPEAVRFETHDAHFDIQYLVAGRETIGIALRDGLEAMAPYDSGADITFYRAPEDVGALVLEAGCFALFGPRDAHRPCCSSASGSGPVRKIVVKVPVLAPGI